MKSSCGYWIHRRILATAVAGAIALCSGCCNSEYRTLSESMNRWDDLGRKCCQGMSDPASRDECLRNHEHTWKKLRELRKKWYEACLDGERELMRNIYRTIFKVITRDPTCLIEPLVRPIRGGHASLVSPLGGVDSVDLDLEGEVRHGRCELAGTICLKVDDATVCAESLAIMAWSRDSGGSGHGPMSMCPVEFSLSFPDLEGVSLEMVPFEGNGIRLNRDGRTTLGVWMKIHDPVGVCGLTSDAWFEFPIELRSGRVAITAVGMAGLDLAPQVPDVIADWNEDRQVDQLDYVAFMEDLIHGRVDLDGDGESNEADLAFFESRWHEAMNG